MSGGYVSPIPAIVQPNYARRDEDGNAIAERRHLFPQHGLLTISCDPRSCREHWREKHWPAGSEG